MIGATFATCFVVVVVVVIVVVVLVDEEDWAVEQVVDIDVIG